LQSCPGPNLVFCLLLFLPLLLLPLPCPNLDSVQLFTLFHLSPTLGSVQPFTFFFAV
jgi:hypothetical protein